MNTNLQSTVSESASDEAQPLSSLQHVSATELTQKVEALGDWFHNIDLDGVSTAPNHFLGDYPNIKWKHISSVFPEDMKGASVLDVGCNAGFYSIALKQRGAGRVLGV